MLRRIEKNVDAAWKIKLQKGIREASFREFCVTGEPFGKMSWASYSKGELMKGICSTVFGY